MAGPRRFQRAIRGLDRTKGLSEPEFRGYVIEPAARSLHLLARKGSRLGNGYVARRRRRGSAGLLAEAGHLNEHGRPFNPRSVKAMVEG